MSVFTRAHDNREAFVRFGWVEIENEKMAGAVEDHDFQVFVNHDAGGGGIEEKIAEKMEHRLVEVIKEMVFEAVISHQMPLAAGVME